MSERVVAHSPFPAMYVASGAATATVAAVFSAWLGHQGVWVPAGLAAGFSLALVVFTVNTTRIDWVAATADGVERGIGLRRNLFVPWAEVKALALLEDEGVGRRIRVHLSDGRRLALRVSWVGADAFGASVQARRPSPGARMDRARAMAEAAAFASGT